MKMGSVALAIAMAIMLISGTVLHWVGAQVVDCLTNGTNAPFADATAVVQQLRVTGGQCCQTDSNVFCTVLLESGNAAASVCGPVNYCPNCADVGNGLNVVLAVCNQLDQVEGVYSPDGTSLQVFYLTSAAKAP